jgi:hypothetical protein
MHRVMFLALPVLLTANAAAAADACARLRDSDDGVPAEYRVNECLGRKALTLKNFAVAEVHFRKALEQTIFEAPNYDLRFELGTALCRQGRLKEAKAELNSFVCMAGVELGRVRCGEDQVHLPLPSSEACREVCDGTGSSLGPQGKAKLAARVVKATSLLAKCGA